MTSPTAAAAFSTTGDLVTCTATRSRLSPKVNNIVSSAHAVAKLMRRKGQGFGDRWRKLVRRSIEL
ncbi:MAG TPA: hypothetical protein PK822_08935 [Bacillota bacterium]|nr:hypothetical protein [Bacillota bacterium]